MIDTLLQASKSDARLGSLLDEAREYAQIYLLAKKRHKGCEGTGEFVTLREEFRDVLEKLSQYCREKGCAFELNSAEPDAAAHALTLPQAGDTS